MIMTRNYSLCFAFLMASASLASVATAFVGPAPMNVAGTRNLKSNSALSVALDSPPPVVQEASSTTFTTTSNQLSSSAVLNTGVKDYLATGTGTTTSSSASSSSIELSLVERKPPTKEEIADKKRNFNLIFWGGGFVAPFLATFFYFGFKFWEK